MKRIIALLLALLMVFALVACAAKEESKPADDKTDAPAADDAAKPDDAPAADDAEREPYELVYMCKSFGVVWCKNIEIAMKSLQEEYNFELLSTDVDYDMDLWMTNVETYCDRGVDGFLLNCDATMTQRTFEVVSEYGIPWLAESTAVRDSDGKLLTPGVELNATQVGVDVGTWVVNNYLKHFGVDSIDPNEIGYISVYYSIVPSFNERCAGCENTIIPALGIPEQNVFKPDLVAQGNFSADASYNEVSPIMSSHPDIKYWIMTGVIDDWALGATRAAEANGVDGNTLIASVGGEALVLEWDNGYDTDGKGCWKMCTYYEAMDFVNYLVPGMIDVLDGKTTIEEIWPEWEEESSGLASVRVHGVDCMRDNYLDLIKMRY